MRVLVCGGRTYGDLMRVRDVLTKLHRERGPILEIVTGGAGGADTLAYGWAIRNEVTAIVVPAKWSEGRKAGPMRNQRMLEQWAPGLCVAFPGGRGTADMVRRCRSAGLEVIEVSPSEDSAR